MPDGSYIPKSERSFLPLKMEERKVIVGVVDVGAFLEAVLDYLRSLDPETGRPGAGNKQAREKLNLCKSIIGVLPFEAEVAYNVARIEKIVKYLGSHLRNEASLHDLLRRAREAIGLYHEQSAGERIPHPKPQPVSEKGDYKSRSKR
jgi:hypothetical protein